MSNQFFIQAINLAMQLLSNRVFSFLSLILTAGGFIWCLYDPNILRIISASIFGGFCLLYQRKDSDVPIKENTND